jgi:hypothetical protein
MPHRLVDVSHLPVLPPPDMPPPLLQWVPVQDLRIDDEYQRPLGPASWAAIQRIADQFDWGKFGCVKVAPLEGGLFALVDGQHRVHAAALRGCRTVPAEISRLTLRQQAEAFVTINARTMRVTPHQLFRAALAAGEDWALATDRAVSEAGCELARLNNVPAKLKRPGQVFALDTVRRLVVAGHARAVTAGLRALRAIEAGGPMDVALYDGALLRPWLGAVAAVPGGAALDLVTVLRVNRPWRVIEEADRRAKAQHMNLPEARLAAFRALLTTPAF